MSELNTTTSDVNPHQQGSAAFQRKYLSRDIQAGIITGSMAIPLSIGIAMMSDYPIKVGLATVAFASFIAWINAWFRPGNFIGSPGIAAGLAPILALGVATFGIENMAFVIFMTAIMQGLIWRFNLQRYILLVVPTYLVEGLLAGIGLKIALKFFAFTYELPADLVADLSSTQAFWSSERMQIILLSSVFFGLFIYLFNKFQATRPAIPYFVIIILGVVVAQFMPVAMIEVEDVDLALAFPIPTFDNGWLLAYAFGFAVMLAVIDVIEQVMSNAAIQKIDPLQRKCNSNNSLLAIWISNLGASFFGGMTNLDGLAKSTTNKLAGAYTKFSVLVVGLVVTFFVVYSEHLEFLPKFALAVIMIFTGWKMIMGLMHVVHHGRYALMLAILCGALVYNVGIFEGLLIALAVHGFIHYLIYRAVEKMPRMAIIKKYLNSFSDKGATY
ncbi:SulP family inorganic anion transporter [Thiomicrorhabdus aquaedulcis]|uniref:SulP family inorganic anion transporter n=1 Tax=Thiomicrorhabdus aquaedulcis TaxID=2211106 RepID=UPI000FDC5C15|nr:SulP family inorganic anion transporter [Thiomicrorhabdus aquaedulcis]